jgi:hypothetical protein
MALISYIVYKQDLSRTTHGTVNCQLKHDAKTNQSLTSRFHSKLWLSMVTTLWAFNISRAKDDSGNEIQISGDYTDGLIR